MPFKIHDDLPIPGRVRQGMNDEVLAYMQKQRIGQCIEIDVNDLNWAHLGTGVKPLREHLVKRIQGAISIAKYRFKDKYFLYRIMSSTSVGIWRIEKT